MLKKIKKEKIRITIVIAVATLLIVILCGLIISTISNVFSKDIYEINSRVNNIEAEQKKDSSEKYKTIGWLKVQGTNIDTPIITFYNSEDEESEEEIQVDKNNYLWNEINDETLYNKVNIMGHNILNLSAQPDSGLEYFSRFDDLMSFVYYDFVKENKYIQYTIDGKDYIYKIFAVNFEKQYNLGLYRKGNWNSQEIEEYIDTVLDESLFEFDVKVDKSDKFISLITCTRMFGTDEDIEFVVNARLVRDGEKLINYKVDKTSNYEKIVKILEGDEENENDA